MTMQEKLTQKYPVDERTAQVNEKRLAVCGVVAIFYVVVRIIYVGFHGELAVPEIVLLFLMLICMIGVDRQNEVHTLPQFMGKPLDPSPAARGKRIGIYLLTGLGLAGSWTAMDYFGSIVGWTDRTLGTIADFAIIGTVCFVLNFIVEERKVKSYNRYMAKLEAEENDLS
ncbi:MAG: hypothetical protein IK130_05295 [Oscillospiraceae bacterium]|nr:hypothetical protein [Oscillospiraceae bacterium]